MSTDADPKVWTVQGTCPHGIDFKIPFDALGYLRLPPPLVCEMHEGTNKLTPREQLDRRRGERKAERKFRRELKKLKPGDFERGDRL